ncbi:MAG TPA: hypothetical protein PK771_11150, partial [Spirochaetota bacterium]|nr:hypothetical protein [Spirochaetota bacterium]
MKKIILILLMTMFSFLVNAFEGGFDYYWNPELFIESPSSIASINHFIVDAGINSPVGGWGPQIKFRTGYLLNDKFRLGVCGDFFNILNANTQFVDNKTWYQDLLGKATGDIQTERQLKNQEWDSINNELRAYLGYRFSDAIWFGFSLSGGSRIGAYKLKEVDITRTFVQGSTNLTANYTDTTSDEKLGYGFLNAGFGVNLRSDFFSKTAPVIDQINANINFDFQINGNGSTANAASTYATVYTFDTTNTKISRQVAQNKYSY